MSFYISKTIDIFVMFQGSKTEDVSEWLRKVELVAGLQNIDDLSKFLPLFLHGAAFAVYEQLDAATKTVYADIKQALLNAFFVTRYQAFQKLPVGKLDNTDTIDAYLADLRGLMILAGSENEQIFACQFVIGLLPDVSGQVKAITAPDATERRLLQCAKANRPDPKEFAIVAISGYVIQHGAPQTHVKHGPTHQGCGRSSDKQADCQV